MTHYFAAQVISGAIVMGHTIAGAFFLRFWSRTRDGLFLAFAAAFWLLALQQALVALSGGAREEQGWTYVIRLAAFILIIAAIVRKNFGSKSER